MIWLLLNRRVHAAGWAYIIKMKDVEISMALKPRAVV